MRIRVREAPSPEFHGDSLTAQSVLIVDLLNPGSAGGNCDHEAPLCFDFRNKFVFGHVLDRLTPARYQLGRACPELDGRAILSNIAFIPEDQAPLPRPGPNTMEVSKMDIRDENVGSLVHLPVYKRRQNGINGETTRNEAQRSNIRNQR